MFALLIREEKRIMAKQPGLDDRHRDKSGQTREKNSNTRIDTLRDICGPDFAPGLRFHYARVHVRKSFNLAQCVRSH